MEIKCPICGKKYQYDRKICQECEDYSVYSGLSEIEDLNHHKWNCSIFLGIDSMAFKPSRTCELNKDLTAEPNNFNTNEQDDYDWNIETLRRYNRERESGLIQKTIGDFSIFKNYKSHASLFYE